MEGATLSRIAREAKIVGGSLAERGEFPYQVSITYGYNDAHDCGGSILSTLLVLTAAHCLENRSINLLKIYAGEHDRSLPDFEQIRAVESFYMHEQYMEETYENDIALIVLSSPLQYTPYVQNIGLPSDGEQFDGYATVAGWGRTKENGQFSSILKKVTVPFVPLRVCKRSYSTVGLKVTDNNFCAGKTGQDSCQGDSGGPAICRRRGSRTGTRAEWVQCGVVSFGEGCARSGFPGVYINVANYIRWIWETERKIFDQEATALANTPTSFLITPPSLRPQFPDFFSMHQNGLSRPAMVDSDAFGTINSGLNQNPRPYFYSTRRCSSTETRCVNGRCTTVKNDDCEGGWKENNYHLVKRTCGLNFWRCSSNFPTCIHHTRRCDGHFDCADGSDEKNCENESSDEYFGEF